MCFCQSRFYAVFFFYRWKQFCTLSCFPAFEKRFELQCKKETTTGTIRLILATSVLQYITGKRGQLRGHTSLLEPHLFFQ